MTNLLVRIVDTTTAIDSMIEQRKHKWLQDDGFQRKRATFSVYRSSIDTRIFVFAIVSNIDISIQKALSLEPYAENIMPYYKPVAI